MVMVTHDGESTFEQRVNSISSDYYARPANIRPFSLALQNPRFPLKHLVCFSIYPLGVPHFALFVEILDIGTLRCENIMIGFET
jgi:hypothetical protein